MQRQNTSSSRANQQRRQNNNGNGNGSNNNNNNNTSNKNNKQQTTTTQQLVPPPLNLVAVSNKLFALNRNVVVVAEFVREQIHSLTHPKTSGTSKEDAMDNLRKAADCLESIISNGDKTITSLGVTTTKTSALSYAQRRIEMHQYEMEFRRGNFVKPAEAKFNKVYGEMSGKSDLTKQQRKRSATEAASSQEPASKVARRTAPAIEEENDEDDGIDGHTKNIQRALELLKDSPSKVSPPADGKLYTVPELIPQLVAIENRKTRLKTWRYLVSKGFVPHLPGRTIRHFFAWCREGDWEKLNRPWKKTCGSRTLLTIDEAKQIAERTPGIGSYSNAQISEILVDAQKRRNEATGRDVRIRDPDINAIRNYRDLLASFEPITENVSSDGEDDEDDGDEDDDDESTTSAALAPEPIDAATLTKLVEEAPVRWNPPANGQEYTVREVAGPLITIRDNQTRWHQWDYLKANRLVPDVPYKILRKFIQQARWGTLDPDQPWSIDDEPAPKKKPPAKKTRLTREDMKKIIALRRELGAGPINDREFKDMVRLAIRQKAEAEGGTTTKQTRLSDKMIKAYRAMYENILAEEEEEEESD